MAQQPNQAAELAALRLNTQLETLRNQRNSAFDQVAAHAAELQVERARVTQLAQGYDALRELHTTTVAQVDELTQTLEASRREVQTLQVKAAEVDLQAVRETLRAKVTKHLADVYGLAAEELPVELFE